MTGAYGAPGPTIFRLLTVNTGSSSLKAALFRVDPSDGLDVRLSVEGIGERAGTFRAVSPDGTVLRHATEVRADHAGALGAVLDWVQHERPGARLWAVGHRVVHGGMRYRTPQRITTPMMQQLRDLITVDPDHLPQALAAIDGVARAFPHVPQVACFDTAFHASMPRVAQLYGLPHDVIDAGVIRYGFHGLSYESVMCALRAAGPSAAAGRVIAAHLGSGASMVAIRDGASLDTTMGFSPTDGLVMSTRAGAVGPGAVLYLLRTRAKTHDALSALLNRRAGLLGVSGVSGDMRELLAREATDARAAEAVALFCYAAKKFLGALAAVLGGVDVLVFTGGIGEHAAPVRARICQGLEFLGIHIDPARNDANAPVISPDVSPVTVRVVAADEELMIARHTRAIITQSGV